MRILILILGFKGLKDAERKRQGQKRHFVNIPCMAGAWDEWA